jgi:glutamate-5-semialdehyde dehydrogenase
MKKGQEYNMDQHMTKEDLAVMARRARDAADGCKCMGTAMKNRILMDLADLLEKRRSDIMAVNSREADAARKNGLPEAMADRMTLTPARYDEMVSGVRAVAALPDPVGRVLEGRVLPSGLRLMRRSVPLGVVGVIFESRPNVTVDIASLCLKSGNACILRGGSECLKTNILLHKAVADALEQNGADSSAVAFIASPDHELVKAMLCMDDYITVIIPRGGEKLQKLCRQEATVPVITGGFGISHIFCDEDCDVERAAKVIVNAKTQKPSACNALDTLLVHQAVADRMIPAALDALKPCKVKVHAHGGAHVIAASCGYPFLEEGKEDDFSREFLALEMNIAIVEDVKAACAHMKKHGASHSDAILTNSVRDAEYFVNHADSACVYVNASTRFSDGGQFGLGAEVAISTQKLHARGPMGLDALTTSQWVLSGDYLSRA